MALGLSTAVLLLWHRSQITQLFLDATEEMYKTVSPALRYYIDFVLEVAKKSLHKHTDRGQRSEGLCDGRRRADGWGRLCHRCWRWCSGAQRKSCTNTCSGEILLVLQCSIPRSVWLTRAGMYLCFRPPRHWPSQQHPQGVRLPWLRTWCIQKASRSENDTALWRHDESW